MRGFFVRQKDVMQCGIACLSMVCRWHGGQWGGDVHIAV